MSNKREKNFTAKEEGLLVSLIKDKYQIFIENKKTDAVSNKEKAEAWEKICTDFNTSSGEEYRSGHALKYKYINIKKRSKKKFADNKQQMYGTGGGPYQPNPLDNLDNEVQELLGDRMSGFSSEFDGDAQIELVYDTKDIDNYHAGPSVSFDNSGERNVQSASKSDVHAEDVESCSKKQKFDDGQSSQNWSKYNPNTLRTPKSTPLEPKLQGADLKTKLGEWVKTKSKSQEIFQRCHETELLKKLKDADERHQLAIRHAEEEHQQKLRFREEEHKQKLKIQEEEHKVNMDILHLQKAKLMEEINKSK